MFQKCELPHLDYRLSSLSHTLTPPPRPLGGKEKGWILLKSIVSEQKESAVLSNMENV